MKKILFFILFFFLFVFASAAELKVTEEHPFFLDGSWIPAKDLKVGDTFKTLEGKTAVIKNVQIIEPKSPFFVYNLEVPFFNNFVVGIHNLIVHNSNQPITKGLPEDSFDCIGGNCKVSVKYPGTEKTEVMTFSKFYQKWQNNPALRLVDESGNAHQLTDIVKTYDSSQTVKLVKFKIDDPFGGKSEIILTENHRIQLKDGTFIRAGDLIPGKNGHRLRLDGDGLIDSDSFKVYDSKGPSLYEPVFKDKVYDADYRVGGEYGPIVKNPYPSKTDEYLDVMGYGESTRQKTTLYDYSRDTYNKDIDVLEYDYGSRMLQMVDDPDALYTSDMKSSVYSEIRSLPENKGKVFDSPTFENGKLYTEPGVPANGNDKNVLIWVINDQGKVVFGNRGGPNQFLPHSSLAEGRQVFGAGEIVVKDGIIVEVNPRSGHYLPTHSTDSVVEKNLQQKFSEDSVKAFKTALKVQGYTDEQIKAINFVTTIN